MIDILIPEAIVGYDLALPPGHSNAGGGMAVKYARVEEALASLYTARRVSALEDVTADIVIVDPLWFCWGMDFEEAAEAFCCAGLERVLICGSEQNLLTWPARWRAEIVHRQARWCAHNTRYQQRLFRVAEIYDSEFLCDPIPEHVFYPAEKEPRIYSSGQISWEKRTGDLVELFTYLQGSDIETCYIGSATTWGDNDYPSAVSERHRLQSALEDVTDIFLGNVSQAKVAAYANTSLHYVHVSEHDTSCQAQEEAGMGGAQLWGLRHPLNAERPVRQFVSVAECAQVILDTPISLESQQRTYDYAMKHWSYEAFLNQFHKILAGG